jgi:hypothetical protein
VNTAKLAMQCPVCGSGEVFYSCTPNCCFNHVCSACGATFEPVSHAAGGKLAGVTPPDPLPDASDPTVECAVCHSTGVYSAGAGVVCAGCGALLRIEYTEVAPA